MPEAMHFYEPRKGHGLPHDPFNAIVGPRPIGWISTASSDGVSNLAPYSFFNAFNYTPPIIGFASILMRETYGELNPRQKQHVSNIQSSGEHLLGIINDLLDLAKIEAGKLELNISRINLATISLEASAMMEESVQSAGLELKMQLPEEPVWLQGDPLRLRQAILNLLSNAIKFTQQGSVTLYLRTEDGQVHWGIRDTGIGIQEHHLDLLFRPFERIKGRLSDTVRGTGLGLALTKQIVDSHGGCLEVHSSYGVGSDFRIIFECEQAAVDSTGNGVRQ